MDNGVVTWNGEIASPSMSIEQAKAAISWWNNNKRHGSIEPKNVRDAREVLKSVDADDKWLHKIEPNGTLEEEKHKPKSNKLPVELTKPIADIGLDDIQFELDRITELAKHADKDGKKRLAYLRGALYNKRWQLNKNNRQNLQFQIQRDLSDIPQRIPQESTKTATEIFQEAEAQAVVITQSTPTKVCHVDPGARPVVHLKKIFSAIATFSLPEITVEVHDVNNTEEAIIQSLLRQVEAIARKELTNA